MVPELALIYGIGLIPSSVMSLCHFESQRRKQKRPAFLRLQKNLKKANLFWADYAGELQSLTDSSPTQDFQNFQKGLLIASYFLIALSWIGFLFHLLLFVSLKKWMRPRMERLLIESRIATDELNENETQQILEILKSSF